MALNLGPAAAITLIGVEFTVSVSMIQLLVLRSRRASRRRGGRSVLWPQATLLVLGFLAVQAGAGVLR